MQRSPIAAGVLLLLLIPAAHAARPFVELGAADGIALDQPRVNVEFIDSGDNSLGPDTAASFLLDTGAERILAAASGVPFFTVIVQAPTRKRRGRFLFDTGAQASIISEYLVERSPSLAPGSWIIAMPSNTSTLPFGALT